MEPKQLEKRMETIMGDISHLAGDVCEMKALDLRQHPERYEELSIQAALSAEKIACKLRSLIFATTRMQKHDYLVRAGEAHEIDISETDGIVQITLPSLLPKKRSRVSSLFLNDPLHTALEEYAAHRTAPRFRECTVCFCYMYENDALSLPISDYDNLQQKQILDTVALHLMTDDNSRFCDVYCTAGIGDRSCTQILLMERERFPAWLAEREKHRKNTSDF